MAFSDLIAASGGAAMIEQSTWAQADIHLAKALLLSGALDKRVRAANRKLAPGHAKLSAALEGDSLLVRQAIASAAQARGLTQFGKSGEIYPFDAQFHEYVQAPARSRRARAVKIVRPGVAAASAEKARVVIRALVAPVLSKAKTQTGRRSTQKLKV